MRSRLLQGAALFTAGALALRAWERRQPWEFRDKVVLITGGSRGLGLLLARRFAAEGARLALVARTERELEQAAEELRGLGAEVLILPFDLRTAEAARRVVQQTVDHYGRLDVLINNAGTIQAGPLAHITEQDFKDSLDIHFWAPLHTSRAAAPHMRRQGGGRIVNISSLGGRVAVPHLAGYGAGKFALVGLSDSLRAEWAADGIRVTTVSPGLMRTGSPPNALFKGRHHTEYTLFAILGALPGLTIDADSAADQIVAATRYGRPELTIGLPAQIASRANVLLPGLTAFVQQAVARILPPPTDAHGDRALTGWDSQTALAPSPLTHLSDVATAANNETPHHAPG
jgi:NAD(P)-dependent dehydrogenase (short-subunit alcohol dehydrogenase family)